MPMSWKLFFHLPLTGDQLRVQSRPAIHRFWGPAWNGGGVCQSVPDLRLHPSHWMHFRSLGGWGCSRHLHPLQGALLQLYLPLPTAFRSSWCCGLRCRSPWRQLLWWNKVSCCNCSWWSAWTQSNIVFLNYIQTGRVHSARPCFRDHWISKKMFPQCFFKQWLKFHPRSAIGLTVQISAKETLPIVKPGLTGMNQSGQIVLNVRKRFANVNVNRWLWTLTRS